MDRDLEFERLSAAERADPTLRWAALGTDDGTRHHPTSEQDVVHRAEALCQEVVVPTQQREAGELQAAHAVMLATNEVETVSIDDVQLAVVTKAASCAAEMAAEVPVARARLVEARREAREAREDLTAFQKRHETVLQGRPPLPEPGKWKRRLGQKGHVPLIILNFLLEAGGFFFLGLDYWREAIRFGAIGGAISAFCLWALHHVLRNGETRFALGRDRACTVAMLIAAAHILFAYLMACVRDGLHAINFQENPGGIGQLLVAPWALSPESMLVVILAAALLLATWLTSVGRCPFPFEDEYRQLWARCKAAEAAVEEAKRLPFAHVKRIAQRNREQLDELQATREEAHRRCRGNFGQAERAIRQYLVKVTQARSLATRCWEAYAAANRQARAAGNPPPRSLHAPLPIAATLDVDRDLLASFNQQLQHALDLSSHSQKATTHGLRVLSIFTADLVAHLERVVEDPGLVEAPPSFEIVLRQAGGPAFKALDDKPVGSNDVINRFLGL
jgi:hypothetical protein